MRMTRIQLTITGIHRQLDLWVATIKKKVLLGLRATTQLWTLVDAVAPYHTHTLYQRLKNWERRCCLLLCNQVKIMKYCWERVGCQYGQNGKWIFSDSFTVPLFIENGKYISDSTPRYFCFVLGKFLSRICTFWQVTSFYYCKEAVFWWTLPLWECRLNCRIGLIST